MLIDGHLFWNRFSAFSGITFIFCLPYLNCYESSTANWMQTDQEISWWHWHVSYCAAVFETAAVLWIIMEICTLAFACHLNVFLLLSLHSGKFQIVGMSVHWCWFKLGVRDLFSNNWTFNTFKALPKVFTQPWSLTDKSFHDVCQSLTRVFRTVSVAMILCLLTCSNAFQ